MSTVLPDFTRWIWLSEEARSVWQLRIAAISRAWAQVEAASVVRGIRHSMLAFPAIEHLPKAVQDAADHGLLLLPLALESAGDSYSASSSAYKSGQPGKYRCAVTRPEYAGRWLTAYRENDELAIGELLGYPSCCAEFYRRVWVQQQCVDTTEHMAINGTEGPPEANILLRWLSVRLVPHLPCSFGCERTVKFGQALGELWELMGFGQELRWAHEMLSWPMEWSALHGVAEIRTPVLTIMARTDWTPDERVVRREGAAYPDEGVAGLRFPYRIVRGKATGSPSFKRSLTPVWELNGFSSAAAMEHAHTVVLAALKRAVGHTLLDLGCGTGRFLEWAQANGWKVAGVEHDITRASAGQVPIRRGDIFDRASTEGKWDVVMLMPGRLIEQDNQHRNEGLIAALKANAEYVLLYAYGDWLKRFNGLLPLVEAAGLGVHTGAVGGQDVEAVLVRTADIPLTLASVTA